MRAFLGVLLLVGCSTEPTPVDVRMIEVDSGPGLTPTGWLIDDLRHWDAARDRDTANPPHEWPDGHWRPECVAPFTSPPCR